ncbi:MAG: hypothetical protein U9Q69_00125 [Nanoarchaeota archaeon]|nr:hypothetical protein [Nanoarchaeota archaeon]
MHNKFNITLILFSIALLILSGCQEQSSNGPLSGPYKVSGNKMVEAIFAQDAPTSLESDPYRVGEEIDVAVELNNKHTEDIPAGNVKVRLTGDAAIPTFFEGAKIVLATGLQGYDTISNLAYPEEIEVGPIRYINEIPTKSAKMITGQYCYEYPVKVKGFLYYTDDSTKISNNLPHGSNPPSSLQVTKISQEPVNVNGDTATLDFRVTVRNVGTGTLVEGLDQCFQYREKRAREYFALIAKGAYPITCENDGYVRLSRDTKEKVIDCKVIGIDATNINEEPSELSLTLTGFAYEDEIPAITIWLEP